MSPFKLKVDVGGKIRWAEADKVFAHLMDRYMKKQDKLQGNLEKRLEKFSEAVYEFSNDYDEEMLEDFIEYWTEPNKSCTKMRFELEKTWSLLSRLQRWSRSSKQYGNNSKSKIQKQLENFSKAKSIINKINNQ